MRDSLANDINPPMKSTMAPNRLRMNPTARPRNTGIMISMETPRCPPFRRQPLTDGKAVQTGRLGHFECPCEPGIILPSERVGKGGARQRVDPITKQREKGSPRRRNRSARCLTRQPRRQEVEATTHSSEKLTDPSCRHLENVQSKCFCLGKWYPIRSAFASTIHSNLSDTAYAVTYSPS